MSVLITAISNKNPLLIITPLVSLLLAAEGGWKFCIFLYQISKATKNIPRKYRVRNRWYISQDLLKTQQVDQVSEQLVQDRIARQNKIDDDAEQKLIQSNKDRLKADVAKAKKRDEHAKAEQAKPKPKRKKPRLSKLEKLAAETAAFLGEEIVPSMRRGARRAREKLIKTQEREAKRDKEIGL